jgi:cellulose synthase/poly-beta-1,6-N-acetylglucosamine synthase-like glycosyltransferase
VLNVLRLELLKVFFLILARDKNHVFTKIKEIEKLGYPYKIICGEQILHRNVIFQPPTGKYAAINFGLTLVPIETEIIVMNDVDTTISNFDLALKGFENPNVALVFGTELVKEGPQYLFFRMMNPIRNLVPIAGSGELMLIRKNILKEIFPLKPCKAEDTYILFKVLENKHEIFFSEKSYAETKRTQVAEKEEFYKRRTVAGIYQALSYTHPPLSIRIFYYLLPLVSPLLLVIGKKGYYWTKGILLGLTDFLSGDRKGTWTPIN